MQEQVATTIIGRHVLDRPQRNLRISGMTSCRAPHTHTVSPGTGLFHLLTRYEMWSPPPGGEEQERALWVLPGEARLVVVQPGGQLSALIGNRRYDSLPGVMLFGPSSRATRLTASGGTIVTIGLSALGWAEIVRRSAAALGDRVVAAADVFDGRVVAALAETLADASPEDIADRIDSVLGAMPQVRCPDEPLVVGLTAIIEQGHFSVAEAAGEQLGVASHVVRRSALRHFGYPPKVLLNRRRFIAALEKMILSDRGYSEAARHGYFDASHFIRDAKRFLGMTPRRFLALAA